MNTLLRRKVLTASVAAIGISVAGCLGDGTDEWGDDETLTLSSATQYQRPNCACCDVYADYLQDHLDEELEVTVTDDLTSVKEEYDLPTDLRSCHTVELDDYVVEGHMPVAVIATVLDEEPDIDGIALPGMPTGSPGMGGEKDETWRVYGIRTGERPVVYTEI